MADEHVFPALRTLPLPRCTLKDVHPEIPEMDFSSMNRFPPSLSIPEGADQEAKDETKGVISDIISFNPRAPPPMAPGVQPRAAEGS